MPVPLQITSNQRAAIEQTLKEIESHIVSRGAKLMRERAVRKIQWVESEREIEAQVQGGQLYTVWVRFEPGQEEADLDCTCPYGANCKHGVAVLLELRKMAILESASQMRSQGFQAPGQEAVRPVAEKEMGELAAELLKLQGGKAWLPKAKLSLAKMEPLWKKRSPHITENELYAVCGKTTWGNRRILLWPEEHPPKNVTEFLAYMSMGLAMGNLTLPSPLDTLVDKAVVQQLKKQWTRLEDIAQWKQTLGQWQMPAASHAGKTPSVEFRLLLHGLGATIQIRRNEDESFAKVSAKALKEAAQGAMGKMNAGSHAVLDAACDPYGYVRNVELDGMSQELAESLEMLLRTEALFERHVAGADGQPLTREDEPLRWELLPPTEKGNDYRLTLVTASGTPPPPPVAVIPGRPNHYITCGSVYRLNFWPFGAVRPSWPVSIPAEAMETSEGVNALAGLGVETPARLSQKITRRKAAVTVRCEVFRHPGGASDYLGVNATADLAGTAQPQVWTGEEWISPYWQKETLKSINQDKEGRFIQLDKEVMAEAATWLKGMTLRPSMGHYGRLEQRVVGKDWPEQFTAWLEQRPGEVVMELDAELASLRDGSVSGQIRLDIEESKSGMDWFDLNLNLEVTDHTLTEAEISLLLKAKGKWVKLSGKGWRKLEFKLTEEQERELAELGLSAAQFSGEKQRLHALQLGSTAREGGSLLSAEKAAQVRRRLDEIQTQVSPPQPAEIQAVLRPYQTEGFHFLAYLATNRFGGVLADDMGLGKTLQALTWLAWLRAEQKVQEPALVVCPKSVQDNWRAEADRFFPGLKVTVWTRENAGKAGLEDGTDLLVIHYPQLRSHEEKLRDMKWGAVILDEAQAIKNPTSQSAQAACALEARHRLALTGTPIENRLLDLWSIFAFAMPGILGSRAAFGRNFDMETDLQARRRLAARTRPFLLRRTKSEVATDLPERVEEDLVVELDGTQAALYQAELKRARAQLLKVETSRELDKMRFNILTSLLRLRQICCHPLLVGLQQEPGAAAEAPGTAAKKGRKKKTAADSEGTESAKLGALLEQLEPILEEGQKVLVFSQFVEMLEIIRGETEKQNWPTYMLTGSTEDRGELVSAFQNHEGGAVFLISLKAGGSGLNLTAASYVVLFDPWWNPAVEAQAIDRTHRIGQKQTVFAYRLIMKDTIEEKIRALQKQKGALAQDILGEESFAQGLSIDDFRFLLG